jgi:hypothetical protein
MFVVLFLACSTMFSDGRSFHVFDRVHWAAWLSEAHARIDALCTATP